MERLIIKPGTFAEVLAQIHNATGPIEEVVFEPGEYWLWPDEGLKLPPGAKLVLYPGTFEFLRGI